MDFFSTFEKDKSLDDVFPLNQQNNKVKILYTRKKGMSLQTF